MMRLISRSQESAVLGFERGFLWLTSATNSRSFIVAVEGLRIIASTSGVSPGGAKTDGRCPARHRGTRSPAVILGLGQIVDGARP